MFQNFQNALPVFLANQNLFNKLKNWPKDIEERELL